MAAYSRQDPEQFAAACGLYCGACQILIACERKDLEQLELMAQRVRKLTGAQITAEDMHCEGCQSDIRTPHCQACDIRACCFSKGLNHCSQCNEFPCQRLKDFNSDDLSHHHEVLENCTRVREIGIDIYSEYFHRFETGFLDYLVSASLTGDDGKDYFLTLTVARMKKRDVARMQISVDPLWFYTTLSSRIIQRGETPEIDVRMKKPSGSLKAERSPSALLVEYDAWRLILSPPTYRVQCGGEDVSIDLTLKSLGTPFWFNQGKEEGCRKTPSTVVWGSEVFCDVEGTLNIKGKEVHVKGNSLFDNGISNTLSWVESIWQDFIWFVFEDLYGLLYHVHGSGYKDGGIFLRDEKKYLVVKDHDMDNPHWAYSPVLQHYWPVGVLARAETEQGVLFIEGIVIRSQAWGQVNKYQPAMSMPGSDMEMRLRGTFTFNDGRTINLGKGRGAYEIYASSNFVQ